MDKFADRVAGIAEHVDEANFHIHVFLVPRDGEGIGVVHPGVGARQLARSSGEKKLQLVYKSVMSAWQDERWNATGKKFGLERFGPRRIRLDRKSALKQREIRLANEDAELHKTHALKAEAKILKLEAHIVSIQRLLTIYVSDYKSGEFDETNCDETCNNRTDWCADSDFDSNSELCAGDEYEYEGEGEGEGDNERDICK